MSYSDITSCKSNKDCERKYNLYLNCPIDNMKECVEKYNTDFYSNGKNPTSDGNRFLFKHPIHGYMDNSNCGNVEQYLRSLKLKSAIATSRFEGKPIISKGNISGFELKEPITSTPELEELLSRKEQIVNMFDKIEQMRKNGEDADDLEMECIDANISVDIAIESEKRRIIRKNNRIGVDVIEHENPIWISRGHIIGPVSFGSSKIKTGPRGGKYITKKGKKIYITKY